LFSLTGYWIRQGNAARNGHRWPAAQKAYSRALRLTPGLAGIWVQYGHALKEDGRLAEALAAYKRSDQLKPDLTDTQLHIAHTLDLLNQATERPPSAQGGQLTAQAEAASREADKFAELCGLLRGEMRAVARAVQAESLAPVTVEQIRSLPMPELDQRFRRQACFWPMADRAGMCRTIGGRLMFVDTSDFTLSPHLMTTGFWELWITQAMARVLRPGMAVADVGANLGYYSVLMAEAVGPEGRVMAFEPNPAMAGLLRRTVSVNGYGDRVSIDARAVSDRSGDVVSFHVPAGQPMNASIVEAAEEAADVIRTTTVTLDDALPARVDFLKIDVEGAERRAWRGLAKTLTANRDIMMFLEVNAGRMPDEIVPFLREIQASGFRLSSIATDSTIKPCTEDDVVAQAPHDVILMLARS
jgi:FkbM family methyltransferase